MPESDQSSLRLSIYEQDERVYFDSIELPLVLGRQERLTHQPRPYASCSTADGTKIVIAGWDEATVSRQHVQVQESVDGQLEVSNRSAKVAVELHSPRTGSLRRIAPHENCRTDLPLKLRIGGRSVRLEAANEDLELQSLPEVTVAPKDQQLTTHFVGKAMAVGDESKIVAKLLPVIDGSIGILRLAATSPTFLSAVAEKIGELLDLDGVFVLFWKNNNWHLETRYQRTQGGRNSPSSTMLSRVREEKRTFRHYRAMSPEVESLAETGSLVASPLLDREGEVLGAIYGARKSASNTITELEAQLFELLTNSVATGLARLEQERAAISARVRFEQFFTPQLARQLEATPDLLSGKQVEISVLFCDIRGFSKASERLGPATTIEWINSVLGELSECVLEQDGVLVDYVGDELMAMWGAPEIQKDHADRACRTALNMLERIPAINAKWQPNIDFSTEIGIGINSGTAYVGNTGSHKRFKYGPHGNTVNLASRVQGVTKFIKCSPLMTESTQRMTTMEFSSRRLCRTRVVNIAEPFDLFELKPQPDAAWENLRQGYQDALQAFESQQFRQAVRLLGNLVADHPDDGASQLLIARAVEAMSQPQDADNDVVWNLTAK